MILAAPRHMPPIIMLAALLLLAGVGPVLGQTPAPTAKPAADQNVTAPTDEGEQGAPELTIEASRAIDKGLKWLLATQKPDGSWDNGAGKFSVASTSLALMAFMVKGEFPGYGPHGPTLDKAKDWLLAKAQASSSGYMGVSMYEHGLATLALSEMWGMTRKPEDDERIQKALEAAVKLILRSQNIGGGWRYAPSPDAGEDTSVTVMVFVALASARQAGILVPDESIHRVVSYLQHAQNPATGGFSYPPTGNGVSTACSGGGLYISQLCGQRDSQMVKAATEYMGNLPDSIFQRTSHFYYTHYYAIQAAVQTSDEFYAKWYPKIRDALVQKQSADGYWPQGNGGPTVDTAMAILILGTPHRFIPIYQR